MTDEITRSTGGTCMLSYQARHVCGARPLCSCAPDPRKEHGCPAHGTWVFAIRCGRFLWSLTEPMKSLVQLEGHACCHTRPGMYVGHVRCAPALPTPAKNMAVLLTEARGSLQFAAVVFCGPLPNDRNHSFNWRDMHAVIPGPACMWGTSVVLLRSRPPQRTWLSCSLRHVGLCNSLRSFSVVPYRMTDEITRSTGGTCMLSYQARHVCGARPLCSCAPDPRKEHGCPAHGTWVFAIRCGRFLWSLTEPMKSLVQLEGHACCHTRPGMYVGHVRCAPALPTPAKNMAVLLTEARGSL
eukprot:284819547_4